ncbi:MAG: type II toxin-antitoxin system PemK/MazF family toxin [Dehalococcoidia bacterium]|nr:MAG: type II toxin-antitoxin system PemK/MazF family toxin [Dehalococcoidia bacterium]
MPSSTTYEAGDVVLVWFRFSGGKGAKKRPAVILSVDPYHRSRADTIIIALTTKMQNAYFGDYDLLDWQAAGLPSPSRSKGVIQTIERATIERVFGQLSARDMAALRDSVRLILGL